MRGSCRRVRRRALHFAAAPMRTSSISASAFFLSETNKLVCFGGGRSTFAVALAVLCAAEPTCASRSDAMRCILLPFSFPPHPSRLSPCHLPLQGKASLPGSACLVCRGWRPRQPACRVFPRGTSGTPSPTVSTEVQALLQGFPLRGSCRRRRLMRCILLPFLFHLIRPR